MKILCACEESQRVCNEFRARGHEAFSCDLLPCSGEHPEFHIIGDVLPLINGGCIFRTMDGVLHTINGEWDMIIAFPPCTFLSIASACRMYPTAGKISEERLKRAYEARDFFMAFLNAKCKKIAIENPQPLKVIELPPPQQIIQPWQFALSDEEYYTKKTCLWLKGLFPLVPVTTVKPLSVKPYVNAGSKGRTLKGVANNSIQRAKTFKGIAFAMAEQWGAV